MDKKLLSVAGTLVAILVIVVGAVLVVGNMLGNERFQTGENPVLRFVFVGIGLLIVYGVYHFTKENKIWEVETRHVVYMAIGAALYAIFSYLFNGTVFVIPSLSQVSLRPAIAIPMFFGYAFGPVVGFFTGAVGNMFGDALTGFGLSPQWSIGNGLVGFISGMVFLFKDKRKSMDTVLYVSGALALIAVGLYFLNQSIPNMLFYDVDNGVFGDQQISIFAGISLVIGFALVVAVRFGFAKNEDIAAAVTWGMLGNLLGIGFAAISDIWINGFSLPATIVGQFLPAAGPNLIFAAVLVPMLVLAYAAVQRQSGR
jgi:uncharacterized membrane protein